MLTIRKSVKPEIKQNIPTFIRDAVKWMQSKYPDVNFENVNYIFSSSYNRSRYFRNEDNIKYPIPNVCICTRGELILYEKKSLEINKFRLFVGSEVQMCCSLIHELTHHVQYEKGIRKGNELDTTANEVEYLKQFHFNIYSKLI